MKRTFYCLLLTAGLLFPGSPLAAREILGSSEAEVVAWAQEKGYQVQPVMVGSSGCLKGRRYIPMTGKGLKLAAGFFHPVYQVDTKIISMVEFEAETPLGKSAVEALAIQVAPIAGTRPPTHRQNIAASSEPCAPANSGYEGRYTEDYIAEYFYAPDRARVEKVRVYNENIR